MVNYLVLLCTGDRISLNSIKDLEFFCLERVSTIVKDTLVERKEDFRYDAV